MLTCSTATSGVMVVHSTVLVKMVVGVVGDHEGATGVTDRVVTVTGVVVLTTRVTTLSITSLIKALSPAVMLTAGLAVTVELGLSKEMTGAVILLAASSNIEEGRNPAARISGSHFTLIGAITKI